MINVIYKGFDLKYWNLEYPLQDFDHTWGPGQGRDPKCLQSWANRCQMNVRKYQDISFYRF